MLLQRKENYGDHILPKAPWAMFAECSSWNCAGSELTLWSSFGALHTLAHTTTYTVKLQAKPFAFATSRLSWVRLGHDCNLPMDKFLQKVTFPSKDVACSMVATQTAEAVFVAVWWSVITTTSRNTLAVRLWKALFSGVLIFVKKFALFKTAKVPSGTPISAQRAQYPLANSHCHFLKDQKLI